MAEAYYSTVFAQSADDIRNVIRDFNNYPVWVDGAGESAIAFARWLRRYGDIWTAQRLSRPEANVRCKIRKRKRPGPVGTRRYPAARLDGVAPAGPTPS